MLTITAIVTFIRTHFRAILIGLGITVVLVSVMLVYDRCKSKPKIDQESITKINNANEDRRKEELKKVIEANAGVIKSDTEDTALVNLEVEKKNAEIDKKVEEADQKVQEAKQRGQDVTSEQLECILVPANCG